MRISYNKEDTALLLADLRLAIMKRHDDPMELMIERVRKYGSENICNFGFWWDIAIDSAIKHIGGEEAAKILFVSSDYELLDEFVNDDDETEKRYGKKDTVCHLDYKRKSAWFYKQALPQFFRDNEKERGADYAVFAEDFIKVLESAIEYLVGQEALQDILSQGAQENSG